MLCTKCEGSIDGSTLDCPHCGEPVINSCVTKIDHNVANGCDGNNDVVDEEVPSNKLSCVEDESVKEEVGSDVNMTKASSNRKRTVSKTDIDQRLYGRKSTCLKADDIIPNLQKQVLQRIVSCYLKYTAGMNSEALEKSLIDNMDKVQSRKRINESLGKFDMIRDKRILKDIILLEIIAQKESYKIELNELHDEVERIETEILIKAESKNLKDYVNNDAQRFRDLDIYNTVLEVAWRNDELISNDEETLLAELRKKLSVSIYDHRYLEVKLGKFPKHHNKIHTREEVDKFRVELQKEGLLWVYKEKGVEYNIIPFEVMEHVRDISNLELQSINYERLLNAKTISKSDLVTVLKSEGYGTTGSKDELIKSILQSNIRPSSLLDTLGNNFLKDLCVSLGIKSSGAKDERVKRIIGFYDDLSFETRIDTDEREKYYHAFELIASRKYNDLKAIGIISKQEEVEHYFERATDYIFEKKLYVSIEKGLYGNTPDGIIYLQNNKAVLWDNKSSETKVNLKDYLETQFDQYMRKEENKGKSLFFFMVIAPCFSDDSDRVSRLYKTETNRDVCLVEAKVLKDVAELWSIKNTDKPFPLGVFNKAGLISFDEIADLIRDKI